MIHIPGKSDVSRECPVAARRIGNQQAISSGREAIDNVSAGHRHCGSVELESIWCGSPCYGRECDRPIVVCTSRRRYCEAGSDLRWISKRNNRSRRACIAGISSYTDRVCSPRNTRDHIPCNKWRPCHCVNRPLERISSFSRTRRRNSMESSAGCPRYLRCAFKAARRK